MPTWPKLPKKRLSEEQTNSLFYLRLVHSRVLVLGRMPFIFFPRGKSGVGKVTTHLGLLYYEAYRRLKPPDAHGGVDESTNVGWRE